MTWEPDADNTTMRNVGASEAPASEPAPYLTVLWHPSIERIGDVTPLPDGLSRNEPRFGPPGVALHAPLGEPHLSRRPVQLSALPRGGVRVEARELDVKLDGRPLDGARDLDAKMLAHGVVLELAGRVAVLLHLRLPPRPFNAGSLVGASDALAALCDDIDRVADLDVPVLVAGETGSGKEHVARRLHDHGKRAGGPFVAVNMATLASGVAAAQLFGHAKGAFTGADRAHAGLFEQAHGGTLFLDEIGDTPAEVQAMLLRALETKEVQPVGAPAPRKLDVRVVAATDADLDVDVESGDFRPQLYHRLAGYRLVVPPLRARVDDVGRLLAYFLQRELAAANAQARLTPDPNGPPWLPPAILQAFARHAWPGNIRELANIARHLAVLGRNGPINADAAVTALGTRPAAPPAPAKGREVTDDELVAALGKHRWNTSATATALGISRTTLYALIDRSTRIRKARDLGRDEIVAARDEAGGDLDRMVEKLQVSKRGLQLRMRELAL